MSDAAPPGKPPPSVLIVEDVAETRRWLADIARAAFASCRVAMAEGVRSGVARAERQSIDVALIDLALGDGSGVEVVRRLKALRPETLCVVATTMGDDASIVAALSAGADGYLLKEEPAERMTRHLSRLSEGVPALSPSVARRIMEHFRFTGPAAAADAALSAREGEVLALIGRGMRNAEAAAALGVAESTVASHVKAIYRKLGISSRAEAAWQAQRMGLSPEPPEPRS